MTSRIWSTSWSVNCDTRRSGGMLTLSMISCAFFWPMPWIYWSAITTRLLVGMFTPAMRAKATTPVAGVPALFPKIPKLQSIGLRATINASTTPTPRSGGPASWLNLFRLVGGVFPPPSHPRQPLPRALLMAFLLVFRTVGLAARRPPLGRPAALARRLVTLVVRLRFGALRPGAALDLALRPALAARRGALVTALRFRTGLRRA